MEKTVEGRYREPDGGGYVLTADGIECIGAIKSHQTMRFRTIDSHNAVLYGADVGENL